jgi:hypothetical protein
MLVEIALTRVDEALHGTSRLVEGIKMHLRFCFA